MSFDPEKLQENEIQETKQEVWDRILLKLDSKADKLGLPIDPGIKESVCAVEVNGFPAYSSCEGHVEKRHKGMVELSPYIGIGYDEPKIRFEGQKEIEVEITTQFGIKPEDIKENKDAGKAFWNYIHQHDVKETPEYLAVRESNEGLQKSMNTILEAFYKNRKNESGSQIVMRKIGPCGHFYVTTERNKERKGVKKIEEMEIESATEEIKEEQAEFKFFIQFIKDRYFNQ